MASLVAVRKRSVFAVSVVTDDWICSWVVLSQINALLYNTNASGTTGLWGVPWDSTILNAKVACPFHERGFGDPVIYKYNLAQRNVNARWSPFHQ